VPAETKKFRQVEVTSGETLRNKMQEIVSDPEHRRGNHTELSK
jgi:hypothetical protein